MKYTKFSDIPQFTSSGNYRVNMGLEYAVDHIFNDWMTDPLMKLNINPDFQRIHRWTRKKQVAWIEFILKGGRTGRELFFNHTSWMHFKEGSEFVLVDGKQRLEAARAFIHNEIPAFDTLYKDYTDKLRLINTDLIINVNNLKTRSEVLQWYIDLNAGGVPHTKKEIEKVRELLEKEKEGDEKEK